MSTTPTLEQRCQAALNLAQVCHARLLRVEEQIAPQRVTYCKTLVGDSATEVLTIIQILSGHDPSVSQSAEAGAVNDSFGGVDGTKA